MGKLLVALCCLMAVLGNAYAATAYDREIVVIDKSRQAVVEEQLKKLLRAYQEEDPKTFLEYVSEDRFRQDYITFEDALYEDLRNYEIHRVDYWTDRVVKSGFAYMIYVNWKKRYEDLDNAKQMSQEGFSRFTFDEINGDYVLVELAGDDLFGASYASWTEQTPTIVGARREAPSEFGGLGNNSNSSPNPTTTPASKADLVPVDAMLLTGTPEHVYYLEVNNAGQAASGPFRIKTDGTIGGAAITHTDVSSIAAGQTKYISIQSDKVFSGPFDLVVELDELDQVDESNESNNIRTFTITMIP